MSPLANATIATVGSGVMAEAMIAGLLRGALVEPGRVVASHPRAERREALEREYGIRTVADNLDAVRDADVILLGIKPQMLNKVGREIGPHLRRGQLVLSVLAGATTAALTGILGHDQVVRSMPNTPARLGKGVTVWYATPETTEEQRAQAAALLGALGLQLEVDDEKMVAMATAVSGTGPTYVFLVMEALIDAAVHLGFPRHVAHDLVIETLEGSTLFAKQSGMHPAELRNMVTSPGGTSAAALHELESGRLRTVMSEAVWAAFRRTVELGDQLESSLDVPAKERPAQAMTAPTTDADGRPSPGNPGGRRALDLRGAERDLWADEAALWDRLIATWAGLDDAAWHLPGAAPSDAGGPDWSLAEHIGHIADWQELAADYIPVAIGTGRWPSDDDYDGGDFDRYNERRRAPWTTMSAEAILARLAAARPRVLAAARHLTPETIRGHEAWGWVYFVLHGHYLDHLAVVEPWTDSLRLRQVDGDPFVADPRAPDHTASARRRRRSGRSSTRSSGRSRPRAGAKTSPRAGPSRIMSAISPTGRRKASAPSRSSTPAAPGWPIRTKASMPGMSATSSRRAARARPPSWRATTRRPRPCWRRSRPSRSRTSAPRTAGAGRRTVSTATFASTSRCSGRWCAVADWPGA